MSTRFILLALLAGIALSSPAYARTKPVFKHNPRVAPVNSGIYKRFGLRTGHTYRLTVRSSGRVSFGGNGFENYSWVANRQAHQATKGLQFRGRTPRSFIVRPPISGTLTTWVLAVQLSDNHNKALAVRLVDLGRRK